MNRPTMHQAVHSRAKRISESTWKRTQRKPLGLINLFFFSTSCATILRHGNGESSRSTDWKTSEFYSEPLELMTSEMWIKWALCSELEELFGRTFMINDKAHFERWMHNRRRWKIWWKICNARFKHGSMRNLEISFKRKWKKEAQNDECTLSGGGFMQEEEMLVRGWRFLVRKERKKKLTNDFSHTFYHIHHRVLSTTSNFYFALIYLRVLRGRERRKTKYFFAGWDFWEGRFFH